MEHILKLDEQEEALHSVFQKIKKSDTILFLGAGASVGEKRYLSKEIIELYESKINVRLEEPNITKWLDVISADSDFSRTNFDNFVMELMQKLSFTEAHRIMAGIPWREIITTNFDLLVEKAFDNLSNSYQKIFTLKTIKNRQQYNYQRCV